MSYAKVRRRLTKIHRQRRWQNVLRRIETMPHLGEWVRVGESVWFRWGDGR